MTHKFDFYEGVKVVANYRGTKEPLIGSEGFIIGMAQGEDDKYWYYAVMIGKYNYSYREDELESNGLKGNKRDFVSGIHLRVSMDGELKDIYYDEPGT